jgi:hypothetical protein
MKGHDLGAGEARAASIVFINSDDRPGFAVALGRGGAGRGAAARPPSGMRACHTWCGVGLLQRCKLALGRPRAACPTSTCAVHAPMRAARFVSLGSTGSSAVSGLPVPQKGTPPRQAGSCDACNSGQQLAGGQGTSGCEGFSLGLGIGRTQTGQPLRRTVLGIQRSWKRWNLPRGGKCEGFVLKGSVRHREGHLPQFSSVECTTSSAGPGDQAPVEDPASGKGERGLGIRDTQGTRDRRGSHKSLGIPHCGAHTPNARGT